jgi:hypothetical protein
MAMSGISAGWLAGYELAGSGFIGAESPAAAR